MGLFSLTPSPLLSIPNAGHRAGEALLMAQVAVGTGMLVTVANRDNPQDYSHSVGQGHFHSPGVLKWESVLVRSGFQASGSKVICLFPS